MDEADPHDPPRAFSHSAAATLNAAWVEAQTRQLFAGLPASLIVSLVIALLLVALQWNVLPAWLGLSWLSLMLVALAGRAALLVSYRRTTAEEKKHSLLWLGRFRGGALLTGLTWGVGGAVLFPANDAPHQVVLAFALAGLTAGAMTSLAIDRVCAIGFAVLTLLPLAVRLAFEHSDISLGMSIMVVLFLGFETASSGRAQRSLYENVRLRIESEFAQQRIQELLGRIQNIAAQVPGMVFQYKLRPDGTRCFPYASEGIRAIYRLEAEDVREDATKTLALIHPDDIDGFMESMAVSARTLQAWQREYRVCFANGEEHWLFGKATPRRESDGSILWHGFTSDITAEKEARLVIEQFKTTLDRTLDCVFMFDADTLQFFYANQGALDQVGYERDELLTMHPYDIKSEFTEARFRAFLQPLINGERTALTFEAIHQHKNGTKIPVEVFLQYISAPGERPRFVAIVRDATERKRIERLKTEFISTVSHELRTPLTSICGALGLVVGGAAGVFPETSRPLLDIAYRNSQRLTLLINDLLDMEKIAEGKMRFNVQRLALSPLIAHAVESNKAYAEQYQVKYRFTEHADAVNVQVDAQRLAQVLSNYLSNAAKFSPRDSDIEIAVDVHGDWVRVSVTDHGPGVPKDFHDRIFQKFSQADSSDTRQKGGTGLGLAITKELIEHMGGKVGFQSKEGEGACFYFELPIAKT